MSAPRTSASHERRAVPTPRRRRAEGVGAPDAAAPPGAAAGGWRARLGRRWARWYGGLPFARKLHLFPALAGAGLTLVVLVNVVTGRLAERRLERLGSGYYPVVEQTWRLEQLLVAIERGLQDAATTADPEHLSRVDSLAAVFRAGLAAHDRASREARLSGGGDAHDAIRTAFGRYYAAARAVTPRLMQGELGDGIAGALADFTARQHALRTALEADARADRAAIVRGFAEERARQRLAWLLGVGLSFAFVLAILALARAASRSLALPLGEAARAADRVAEGDLSVELPYVGDDDVGRLLRSMARMVSNLRRSEDRLVHQATHDALTGLANRVLFRERVERELADAARRTATAVLYVDLDDFKDVNDALGHDAGDELLRTVARRMLTATRGCDTVARLGGDEFAVLLEGVPDPASATVAAERVVRALVAPVRVRDTEVRVGASVGIALGADAADAEALLRNADLAMYAAKHGGKHRCRLFAPEMAAAAQERLALERDLRVGIARGELVLHYQPIVHLATGAVVGAEALVRWQHPTRGLVPPGEFVPLAESSGLVVPLGRWVLGEACRQAAAWRAAGDVDAGGAAFRVSVNVSAAQVQHAGLVEEVRAALAEAGLPPSALTLEITETVLLTDTEATLQQLRALEGLGVRLAIDDFGTGYSSLGYLTRFPLDVLKVDKSFVDDVEGGAHDATVTRAIVALGRALHLEVVAEGIETAAQAEALRALGCELGQGYHFGRPVPAAALAARVAAGAAGRHRAPDLTAA